MGDKLKNSIHNSDVIILLIGERYGSESNSGESWTEKEVMYAMAKGKKIFAYKRRNPNHVVLVDIDRRKNDKLRDFITMVEANLGEMPPYIYKENHILIGMVVCDVDRYAIQMENKVREQSYINGFE